MEKSLLNNDCTKLSHIIDYHKEIFIPQENFRKYISCQILSIICNDVDFIKANIVLDSFNEGRKLLEKLKKINEGISIELNRYKNKELQEYNASLKHLRQEKEELEEVLSQNEAYQKWVTFDFHKLNDKIAEVSKEQIESYKGDKDFKNNLHNLYSDNISISVNKLFEQFNKETIVRPIFIFENYSMRLSLDKIENKDVDILIKFYEIKFTKSLFYEYNQIPKNLERLEKANNETDLPEYIKDLNKSQRYAVTFPQEHILVLAGAGCGKTKTIISRAAYLISKGITPNRIQILTFTKKAANEIINRVNNCLGKQYRDLKASTFHQWCLDIIKSTPEIFGYRNFTLIDREEQLQIFKKLRSDLHLSKNLRLPKNSKILDAYSFARNTKKSFSKIMESQLIDYLFEKEQIAKIMKSYELEKQTKEYLDYDDILDIVASAIGQNEGICKWLAEKYDYILVDEMQDTNPLQWNLLEPLSKYTKFFCVGDDAQAIYGFRGADFENIHSFQNKIPNSVVIKLEDNYRSTQEILDISNWLLKASSIQYNKELKAVSEKGNKVELHSFVSIYDETAWIAENILERYRNDNVWNNKLVLVRSSYSGRNIEVECLKHSIPYVFIGGQKLLDSAHIKDLISLLRIVANYKDELAWLRFLTLFDGVGNITANKLISKIIECSNQEEVVQLLENILVENCGIKDVYKNLLYSNSLEQAIDISINFFNELLMYRYGQNEWKTRKNDFIFLKELSKNFTDVTELIEEFLLNPIYNTQNKKDNDYLIISTIHSAKGTEADIVYITDVSVGKYPSLRELNILNNREEERRVLYVAMTRAKKELIITRNTFNSEWIDEDLQNILQNQYFLRGLPPILVKETRHKAENATTYHNHFQQTEMLTKLPNKYKIRISQIHKQKVAITSVDYTEHEIAIMKLYECSKISITPLLNKIRKSKISKTEIQNSIGLGHNYLDKLTKDSKPIFENIKRFADYFCVDVSDCFEIIKQGNPNQDDLNQIIVDYMKTRKDGDLYPKEIKEAVISEYKPNVYGFKKIGKKYGINPDVIKGWVKK